MAKYSFEQASANDLQPFEENIVMRTDLQEPVTLKYKNNKMHLIVYDNMERVKATYSPKTALRYFEEGYFNSYSYVLSKNYIIERLQSFIDRDNGFP